MASSLKISEPVKSKDAELRTAVAQDDQKILSEISFLDQQRIEDLKQNRAERKKFATLLFMLIIGWLIAIGIVLFSQGLGFFIAWKFSLSESVMLALIGGTTINVLGLFLVVVKYLFKSE